MVFKHMANEFVGYAHLVQVLSLHVLPIQRPALVRPVTSFAVIGDCLAVPQRLTPAKNQHLAHVLFALKHEGINLAVLAQALPMLAEQDLLAALTEAPGGTYIRKACFLWEAFTGRCLGYEEKAKGNAAPLFDPHRYITGPSVRSTRWRIDFNGLGTPHYCATIERTATITALLDYDVLGRSKALIRSLPPEMKDRAIQSAYLHETLDSFAIEREIPSQEKADRFVQLLRMAHEDHPLTENYLVRLQTSTISNSYDMAATFRRQQNRLSNGVRGAAGVTYVPPEPDLCRELMKELMAFANAAPKTIDPLVAGAVISFGFVFLHQFMDGNGRLSRFLIHQALCSAGALEDGLLLPISVAMKREEQRYLQVLQGFSRPAREFWSIGSPDGDDANLQFKGDPSIYRYWNATDCVTFTLEMAKQAVEVELRKEVEFLQAYDSVVKAVDARFDVRGSDLSLLVRMCLDNRGKVSQHRREQFRCRVEEHVFDYIEEQAQLALGGSPVENEVE